MRKCKTLMFACTAIVLLLFMLYYIFFTRSGEVLIYNTFGGNDLHITSGEKEIYWFDVRHSNDPDSPMFERLENTLLRFKPDLVLVEGGANDFEGDRDTAIYNGESTFATWLAKENAITVNDIEPPFNKQIEYLKTKYSFDVIFSMFLIRQISSKQFMPDNSQTDFNELLLGYAQKLKINGLNHGFVSQEDILSIINSYLPEKIDADNWRDVDAESIRYVYARKEDALYSVYNDTVDFRNIWLVDLIAEKKKSYDKIYVVMGGSHLIETKNKISELYAD